MPINLFFHIYVDEVDNGNNEEWNLNDDLNERMNINIIKVDIINTSINKIQNDEEDIKDENIIEKH